MQCVSLHALNWRSAVEGKTGKEQEKSRRTAGENEEAAQAITHQRRPSSRIASRPTAEAASRPQVSQERCTAICVVRVIGAEVEDTDDSVQSYEKQRRDRKSEPESGGDTRRDKEDKAARQRRREDGRGGGEGRVEVPLPAARAHRSESRRGLAAGAPAPCQVARRVTSLPSQARASADRKRRKRRRRGQMTGGP